MSVDLCAVEMPAHRRTCEHEAAHAAAAMLVGGLEPREARADRGGHVRVHGADLRSFAVVALAGGIHERFPNWPPPWPPSPAATPLDERQLADLVAKLGLDAAGYETLIAEARELCGSPLFKRLAGLIADELEEREGLDAHELTRLKAIAEGAERMTTLEPVTDTGADLDPEYDRVRREWRDTLADYLVAASGGAERLREKALRAVREHAPVQVATFDC